MKKKDFNYYMSLNYPVEISVIPEDEGGGYFACIPLLSGCWSDGETFEEAYKNILEVKGLWIEDMLDRGMPINEPNIKPRFSGRFVVRVPKTLHRLLAEESEREGEQEMVRHELTDTLQRRAKQAPQTPSAASSKRSSLSPLFRPRQIPFHSSILSAISSSSCSSRSVPRWPGTLRLRMI